jgi:hypothetical protein
MDDVTTFQIELDETVKENELFQSLNCITICKPEIFKYAIMMWEVPTHIKESDFDYLQSKIPGLELLISDHIRFYDNRIENLSKDDRVKKIISEAIGVGIGLKYSSELLKSSPNKFKKIGAPEKGKYLDYSTIVDNKEFEIETKGTVSKYYSAFKKDILAKKNDSSLKVVYQRFGTISMYNNAGETSNSKCVIVDDPPSNSTIKVDDTFETQLLSYAVFLSYILDSKYYNKYIKPLKGNKRGKIRVNEKKFFAKYSLNGKQFYGECFDYRLIRENIVISSFHENALGEIFDKVTKAKGQTKFFIGIEESVINSINKREVDILKNYKLTNHLEEGEGYTRFLDQDGILIVKSMAGGDQQLEKIFTEEEVKKRLGFHLNFLRGKPHKCNAPCKSRLIKGKPCDKLTYRQNCHFHR